MPGRDDENTADEDDDSNDEEEDDQHRYLSCTHLWAKVFQIRGSETCGNATENHMTKRVMMTRRNSNHQSNSETATRQ